MKLSKLEQETIFLANEEESCVEIYTFNPALQKQLIGLCESRPEQVRLVRDNGYGGMTFELPKKWVRVVPPRVLTPAQREVLDRINRKKRGG